MMVQFSTRAWGLTQLAQAPLKFRKWLGPVINVTTSVHGKARSSAVIVILFAEQSMWTTTLTQEMPKATLPYPLINGSTKMNKGAKLVLTPPPPIGFGMVTLQAILHSSTAKRVRFSGEVAHWPLSSAI